MLRCMDSDTRKQLNALTGRNLRFYLFTHQKPKRFCRNAYAMGLGDAFDLERRRQTDRRAKNKVARASRKVNRQRRKAGLPA